MSGYDPYSLVTAKAGTVVFEGLSASLATPAGGGGITPAGITVVAGMSQPGSLSSDYVGTDADSVGPLRYAPSTVSARTNLVALRDQYESDAAAANTAMDFALEEELTAVADYLTAVITEHDSQRNSLWGGSARFVQRLQIIRGHVQSSFELQQVSQTFAANEFRDYGAESMSDLSSRGLAPFLENRSKLLSVIELAARIYDLSETRLVGSPASVVRQLINRRLANSTGLIAKLEPVIDLDDIGASYWEESITQCLRLISDSSAMTAVKNDLQLPRTPRTLADLLDIEWLLDQENLVDIREFAGALADRGALFDRSDKLISFVESIEVRESPSLNNIASPGDLNVDLSVFTGTGNRSFGCPGVDEFVIAISGNAAYHAVSDAATIEYEYNSPTLTVTGGSAQQLKLALDQSAALLDLVRLDTSIPSLDTAVAFVTLARSTGAESPDTGTRAVLEATASDNRFGDAVLQSITEGKNSRVLAQAGIAPLDFTG